MHLVTTHHVKSVLSLYTLQMRYLLSTQNQISSALEWMSEAASDEQLKEAFHSHRNEVGFQRERLNQILIELTGKADDAKCAITAALIAAVEKTVRETDPGPVRDAWLVASGHKIGDFEIASYGVALKWALILGYTYEASLLQKTLDEEARADGLLQSIAERINLAAKAA